MDVGSTSGVGGAGRVDGPQHVGPVKPSATSVPSAAADKVQLSPQAKIASDALALPAVRAERVDEIKKLIESGRFDTDARLESALDGFLAENPDLLEG